MKEEKKEKNYFELLNSINVSDKTEKKKDLTYLSWAWAWGELKKIYPNTTYNIKKFGENNLPYVYDEKTGYMVFTEMTIENITHEMWLPVMDGANKPMKKEPYDYKTKYGVKTCESANMFDINKTIMRCLVKNIAMFGLGLYIYAGEDLPENEETPKKEEINYRDLLVNYIKSQDMDFTEIAKEYKINTKTTNTRFKEVLEILQSEEVK